ncbi:MAG: penicillin-binding transpeptidase domain-containing protein [Alphaproteobacteria bacterium]|jgi:cell division protein FtsI (penicillin-binding protein 3)|nr:MAG: cell division protein [SAR92 bacterium BACL16 MAG-120619-bin48]KRP27054.1 MAG: cell division protein [SAR92 bacterium BACL16 MAG-120322-bin99]MDP4654909.1 penicillin-binding transpeptidase domain-containing protein [Alphaproteobacteria bacterium]MDP4753588.1 penicillin-binding transpeptidase domain-containing protein [Porticoccaceae bacterium]|tara:strand:- start:4826 stop:6556 length:1731 start_codon:yes stop_codon:yes gene_type:complete
MIPRWRYYFVMLILALLPLAVLAKIAQLQIMPSEEYGADFLQTQGDARSIRTETIPAHRGLITDRNGEPLAVSTPVTTLIANPQRVQELATPEHIARLAKAMNISVAQLEGRFKRYRNKSFMYLERQLPSAQAERILDLRIPGVFGRQEYKRFYPAGEVTAQLVGFTDINDDGQEGMELAYNAVLTGESGAKKVVKDLTGRVIKDISLVKPASPGNAVRLSIDLRVQYAAYRSLKAAVKKHRAKSGSVIVLDVQTGEVLAMANQPSFNPNDRTNVKLDAIRNRAVTDMMEPGSTVKPFTLLAALESGKFKPESVINTSPGRIKVSYKTFVDPHDYGRLDLAGILTKSSQVGTTKLALQLNPDTTRELFERMGFGESIGSGFPGETSGSLPSYRKWDPVTQSTFSFGYGISASALQLARAYSILASNGFRKEVSMVALDDAPESVAVIDPKLTGLIRTMLETAASDQGTGKRAMIDGYSVGGKTGTLHKVAATGGYDQHRYMSIFAGLSPVDQPRIVTIVVIDEPGIGDYFGGLVAAPVFSEVTGSALRLLQVPPDQLDRERDIGFARPLVAKRGGL